MGLTFSAGDDFVAQLPREGDIDQGVPVDVPKLPPADPELKSAEPVRCSRDVFPSGHLVQDAALRSRNRQGLPL